MTDSVTNKYDTLIRVDQVWADNDPRCKGRTLQVIGIEMGYLRRAVCMVLTDAGGKRAKPGQIRRIKVDRMHPTSSGYRLVHDITAVGAELAEEWQPKLDLGHYLIAYGFLDADINVIVTDGRGKAYEKAAVALAQFGEDDEMVRLWLITRDSIERQVLDRLTALRDAIAQWRTGLDQG
ncbi:hypothetical protein [Nocardia asiatica]|uniref:hypothetical protein n=1 Tax=Nocardia asiatica TaxID=209252 RepID=UPI0002E6C958|nr:hypothetical protein [Nocardia asiatica]